MASSSNLIQAMSAITLEDEEEGGIVLGGTDVADEEAVPHGFNNKLCLVGRFIIEGIVDFQAMQHTLASLWKPGKGVHVKEIETNLYVFQFFHEIDLKRVVEGSPWSFNRKTLIIARMKEGEIPREVKLNALDLWVQIYDLRIGFMTEKVLKEIGNYVGTYIESCSSNFTGAWRDYMRIRVKIDLDKPLKRKMKIRKTGADWFWVNFKYENVPTFCFICGHLGHSEKFCGKLFDIPEEEITKPYGVWMRAPLRKQTRLVGSRWLRNDTLSDQNTATNDAGNLRTTMNQAPRNQEVVVTDGINQGDKESQNKEIGGNQANLKKQNPVEIGNISNTEKGGVTVVENKKRRTNYGLDADNEMGQRTELMTGYEEEEIQEMDHDVNCPNNSKNGPEASSVKGARLGQ